MSDQSIELISNKKGDFYCLKSYKQEALRNFHQSKSNNEGVRKASVGSEGIDGVDRSVETGDIPVETEDEQDYIDLNDFLNAFKVAAIEEEIIGILAVGAEGAVELETKATIEEVETPIAIETLNICEESDENVSEASSEVVRISDSDDNEDEVNCILEDLVTSPAVVKFSCVFSSSRPPQNQPHIVHM